MLKKPDLLPKGISIEAEATLNKKLLILTVFEKGNEISRLPIPVKVWGNDTLLSTLIALVLSDRKEGLKYNVYSPRKGVSDGQ